MKRAIIIVILAEIFFGVLGVLSGDMTTWIAMTVTIVISLAIVGVLCHFFKPREKRVEKYNPLSPTLRWMNTAGSILLASNPGSVFYKMGGYGDWIEHSGIKDRLKEALWEYWGIQGSVQAEEEMCSLLTRGMRASYRQDMERMDRFCQGFNELQLIEEAKKKNPNADEDSYLPKMMLAWRRYGENALLGWDVGRCALICQWCYLVGYMDMQTMLDICVEAGQKAQAVFQNWEEMMESYLLGVQYWQHEDRNSPGSMTADRWALYEGLWKGERPWQMSPYLSIPFDQPLSKENVTDKFGIIQRG